MDAGENARPFGARSTGVGRHGMHRLKSVCLAAVATALLSSPLQAASLATACDAGCTEAASAAAASAHPPPVPLLWKVSDADNAVYLLGSFHLLKPGDYPVSADIDAAFAVASKVVFEVTPEQLADPTNAQRILDTASYGDTRTLRTVLPPGLHEKLALMLVPRDGSTALLDNYKPWFVNLSLVLGLSQALGFSADHGLDLHLMQRAAAAGKPTAGLESMEVQLRALDAAPIAEQIGALADFLDRPQAMPGLLADLHGAWRAGDVERLDALTRAQMHRHTPETYRILNVERNDAWMPQLRAMLDRSSSDVLVVVGALHLLGDDGVVEKLQANGYRVERVCSACTPALVAN